MTQALSAGPAPRRRALFGLLDADGWGWASVKAFFWFILILFLLGYLPDRAYYFTVGRTLDLGILAFSPVNFCPPENETLPCPAPQGAVLPWHPSPTELSLPEARTDGALVQLGNQILFIGGSDGTTATGEVLVATTSGTGNFDRWARGPSLPAPRADAGVAFFGGSIYVVGGYDADGAPTDTTFVLTPDAASGALGEWQTSEAAELPLDLPEARAGASLVALADGLLLAGGASADGPTATVWKATLEGEALTAWAPQPRELAVAVTDAVGVLNGDYVWIYGGTDAEGRATGAVQRGTIGSNEENDGQLVEWGVRPVGNLPEARTNASGWAANGALYLVGGSDGTRPRGELYWAVPSTDRELGEILTEWHHLPQSDLPAAGLSGAATLVSGPNAILVGGETADGPIAAAARSNLAPMEPFFRLGLLGATVPALKIDGEIGQQLGYLNATGVGSVNFAILVVIGWMFAHKEQTRRLWDRIRRRGR
ncbi:MAG TPA: hypothetical protein VFR14_02410 [Candidatus Limnocylindrales bacterium]|nr:hypothetical protein [Candidatus Limnocylindrales bacterium]